MTMSYSLSAARARHANGCPILSPTSTRNKGRMGHSKSVHSPSPWYTEKELGLSLPESVGRYSALTQTQLEFGKRAVNAVLLRQEFSLCAGFNHAAILEDNDAIGGTYRR